MIKVQAWLPFYHSSGGLNQVCLVGGVAFTTRWVAHMGGGRLTPPAMNSASEFVDQIKELKAAHDKTAASLKEAKEEIKELRFLLQGKAPARI